MTDSRAFSVLDSRDLLSALDANGVAAVFVKDVRGAYRSVNRACELLWGLSRERILGRTDHEILPPECADQLRASDVRVMRTGEPLEVQESLDTASGRRIFLSSKTPVRDQGGAIVGVCGVAIDITALKRVEASLRESEERFRRFADHLPVLVWMSGPDKSGVWFNKKWLEFTGRTLEEELGDGWLAGVCGDDAEALRACAAAFEQRRPFSTHFRMRRHDGVYRWMLDTGSPRVAPDGTFEGFVGTCVDITDRIESEQRARASEERLQRQAVELIEADQRKNEFLAMLGHELRNPLAPIAYAADLLSDSTDRAAVESAAMIRRQVDQLSRLVDDLLDVARIKRGRIVLRERDVALREVLARAFEIVGPSLRSRGHEVQYEAPAPGVVVHGDEARLSQVFANLLHNAAKFTPAGGHVEVTTTVEERRVAVAVRDDGRGMAPETRERVFEPFEQGDRSLDRSEGGLGLGLTLVRELVRMHGGDVEVESAGEGCGTTVTVRLPRTTSTNGDEGVPPPAPRVRPRRILVVDDNRDAADGLAMLLRAKGHVVEVAYDGSVALQRVRGFAPEVALLDLGLPGLDGFQLARQLRAGAARMVLIALTGYGQETHVARARDAGFDHFLLKPLEGRRLDEILGGL